MCKEEQFPVLSFEEFLGHTQSVERCVKLISEATMKVCGETARHGYIRAKFQARKELPTFDNKGHYCSNTCYSICMRQNFNNLRITQMFEKAVKLQTQLRIINHNHEEKIRRVRVLTHEEILKELPRFYEIDSGDIEITDLGGGEEYVPTKSNNSDDESYIRSQYDSECHESNSSGIECTETNPQASIIRRKKLVRESTRGVFSGISPCSIQMIRHIKECTEEEAYRRLSKKLNCIFR
ncbi:hypothetical protein AVEN_164198-1 [Araneus ventricosus]|uniref:Uncharacterized protein n=1 Tax=Araneus ventricosus TaxID=182803 RepID=A0A4Y2JMI5_ARAVE|nr:hypothetical protein AVEN_164198-1 [Araneus ventricosus]